MISLIISTINRSREVNVCIESALLQSGNYEIVVVDQSERLITYPSNSHLRVILSEQSGLSLARNIGAKNSSGDIVAFVDDDAILGENYFSILEEIFKEKEIYGVAGRILVKNTDKPYAKSQIDKSMSLSNRRWNVLLGGNMAFRRLMFEKVGQFDERFGVGTCWASAEESDFFFRMYYAGYKIIYQPKLVIFHPLESEEHSVLGLSKKLFSYGKGHGALFGKHFYEYKNKFMLFSFLWSLFKPFLRVLQYSITFKFNKVRIHMSIFMGKLSGFLEFSKEFKKNR